MRDDNFARRIAHTKVRNIAPLPCSPFIQQIQTLFAVTFSGYKA
jgi:hypothetical protein